jgi:MFS transporter, DHA3 family, tetracycline resistance protein
MRQPLLRKLDPYRVFLFYAGLGSLAFTLVFTINMVYQVQIVGLNPLQLVLVGTVLEITAFLFEIPTGIVADVYSRRLSVIAGSLLIGAGFIIEGSFPVFAGVLLAQVVWGIGATFISGAADAWLADEIGEKRAGPAYLRASQVGQLVAVPGIILSVALASISLPLAIIAGGALHIVVAVFLLLFMPEDGFTPAPKEERQSWRSMTNQIRDSSRMVKRRPVLLTILGITAVIGAYSEGFDRLWTAHLLENFTLPAIAGLDPVVWFGVISMVSLLIGVVVTGYARRRVRTDHHASVVRVLLGINLLLIGSVLVFALAGSLALALVAFWVIGPLRSLEHPLQTAWINQGMDPKVRATMLSVVDLTNSAGQIAGGPAIGYIGHTYGVRTALGLGSVILAPALLLYTRTLRRGDSSAPVSDAADATV